MEAEAPQRNNNDVRRRTLNQKYRKPNQQESCSSIDANAGCNVVLETGFFCSGAERCAVRLRQNANANASADKKEERAPSHVLPFRRESAESGRGWDGSAITPTEPVVCRLDPGSSKRPAKRRKAPQSDAWGERDRIRISDREKQPAASWTESAGSAAD